jgi:PAS domain S-box-containing protein
MTNDDKTVFETKKPKLNIVEPYLSPMGLRWIRTHKIPTLDEKGDVSGLIGFSEEITEQKKAEESLLESEERYRLLYQSAGIGVGYYTVTGEVISYNEIALQNMGRLKLSDVVGKSIFDLFPKENAEIYLNRIKTTNESGKSLEFIDEVALPKGKMWFLSVFSSVKNAEGKTIGIQIMSADITKQKLAEQEVADSRKRIEEINEKLRVVGGLTRHDVRNKLMAAKTSLYLLKQKSKNYPELKDFIASIDDSLEQSSRIFEFSTQYEKIGSEKLTQVSVKEEFDKAAKLTSHKNIDIECNTGDLTVLADSMLQQLFYNFIDNSLKHGKTVSKIRLSHSENNDNIRLMYEDNGIGIPLVYKNKIFIQGFTTGGSGLGLKLAKKMVEVYGWTITEDGEEGKGAKFVITIPIDKSHDI